MIIITAITLVIVFAILVIFHEFGHFTAAKLVGIRVEEFAIGFGPKLMTLFKKGDTEYTIHPFPLGGFVKLTGMEPGDEEIPYSFQAQPVWKRAVTIFAGPFASFVLAVLVFVGMGIFFGFPDSAKPQNRVGVVMPQTEAARIGLRSGDHILEIDGKKVIQGMQLIDFIHKSPGKKISLTIQHNGNVVTKTAVPKWQVSFCGASWSFMNGNKASVEDVYQTGKKAPSFQPKDTLISINNIKISSGPQMIEAIKRIGNGSANVTLNRNGIIKTVNVKPTIQYVNFAGAKWVFPGAYVSEINKKSVSGAFKTGDMMVSVGSTKIKSGEDLLKAIENNGKLGKYAIKVNREDKQETIIIPKDVSDYIGITSQIYDSVGLIGFMPESDLVKAGFIKSVEMGLEITWGMATQLVQTLTSSRIKDEVGGPIMIAQVTASSVARGPYAVLTLLGGLSMSLAVINLVPIPVVDGGHLAILLVEAIRRKRLTREQMGAITMAGLIILAGIFIFVMSSDIFKISKGLVPR